MPSSTSSTPSVASPVAVFAIKIAFPITLRGLFSPLDPLGLTKECLNISVDASSLEAVIAMEDRQQILVAQTGDMREGIAAFLERRPPEYKDE